MFGFNGQTTRWGGEGEIFSFFLVVQAVVRPLHFFCVCVFITFTCKQADEIEMKQYLFKI